MRAVLRATVVAIVLTLGFVPLRAAAAPSPARVGDMLPTFVAWSDLAGHQVETVERGQTIVARYTVTNQLTTPIRVDGVDSQVMYGNCARDFVRASHETDIDGQFPIYLEPGQTSAELVDVPFTFRADSSCATSAPTWTGNTIGERTTGVPKPSVATVAVTETTTVTETQPRDATPLYIGAAAAGVVVLAGLAMVVARLFRRGGRRATRE